MNDRSWAQGLIRWQREEFEERAAIMEFDGGMPRAEAETKARADCTLLWEQSHQKGLD